MWRLISHIFAIFPRDEVLWLSSSKKTRAVIAMYMYVYHAGRRRSRVAKNEGRRFEVKATKISPLDTNRPMQRDHCNHIIGLIYFPIPMINAIYLQL